MVQDLNNRNDLRLAALLLLGAIIAQLMLLSARQTSSVVSGDEGTFLAMTESLALDGDLAFRASDLSRLEAAPQIGRKAVILQEFRTETAYSKPVVYSLLAAPWYRVAGVAGMIALHVGMLGLGLVLAWAALARVGARNPAVTVATFAGTGVLMSYVAWTMSDSLQASLTLVGLVLGLGATRAEAQVGSAEASLTGRFRSFWIGVIGRPWAPYLGVALLALVVSMRLPNLALAAAPPLAWLLRGRPLRSFLLAGVVVLVAGLGFLANLELAGAAVPYKSVRATFNAKSGYPVGPQADEARRQFSETVALATQRIGVRPEWEPEVTLYSSAYFWIGRHTGLVWYFPAAIVLLIAGVRRPDAAAWAILLSVTALAVFYLIWMPRNYFGGATFLGNRYFLTGYAALLLFPQRGATRGALGAAWLVAAVVFGSAVASVVRTGDLDESSQNHAYAGIFRLLPYESTALDIDGRSDVYWTEEFFRFMDPYAVVDPTGFSLRANDPPARVLHASQREKGVIRFLARADSEVGEIVYRGQGVETTFEMQPSESGVWGLVEIELVPAKRRHKYWFHPTARLHSRTYSFQLRSSTGESDGPSGKGRSAELHYLGSMRLVPKFFRGVAMSVEMPRSGRAGKTTAVQIRVRNTGYRFWSSEEMIPTRLGYRLFELPRKAGDRAVAGRLQDFEGRIPRASEYDAELSVRWPEAPGRYELVVDLNLGGAVWYEQWNQQPLARAVVRVRAAERDAVTTSPMDSVPAVGSDSGTW